MKKLWPWPWSFLSLRQTLFMGAGVGILLPALMLAYFQIASRFESEVNLRVRVPMQQYAEVLSRGVAVAIWNVDRSVAGELVDAVMRNPDVVSVTVTDEYKAVFFQKQSVVASDGDVLREERDIYFNGTRVGRIAVELTSARIKRELRSDLFKLGIALAAQVGISFLFIWLLFDRRLMRPLKLLQEGASRLARGELDQPMRWQRKDEIGSLADGLDHMRTDLRALLSERDQKNAALQYELVERQRTEQALGVIQAKFSAIFDASPVAMSVSSFGGEFTLLDVNSAWVRVFARVRSNALGQSGIKIGIWRDLAVRQKALDILLSTGELSAYPAWCKRGEGLTDIFCEISGKVIVLGSESLLILVFEDITAKHRYEENILSLNASLEQRVGDRTQELSSALSRLTAAQAELVRTEKMAALGSLVAGVAHELNTPIGNSLTVASTLQDQARAFAGEMARGLTRSRLDEYVTSTQDGADILMRGLRHAADLVSSFKQVAVDQTSANRRQFNLNEMVSEVLLTLGPSIRKTTHRVECSIPLDITLDSYPGPLGQVITNLINNALVHAFEGRERGTVSISAALQGSEQVLFLVRDDGVGIPEANIARVFDPFFTTKLGKGGSGLGLNIVFNLVQDVMGGSIQVESSNGQGSSFSIRVPRVAPVAASV